MQQSTAGQGGAPIRSVALHGDHGIGGDAEVAGALGILDNVKRGNPNYFDEIAGAYRSGFDFLRSGPSIVIENNGSAMKTENLKPWPKGVSGNPGGRPKGIAARAREHTDRAIEVLVEGMEDGDPKVRIAAARELLDRGYGKAVTMTADVSSKLDDMDDDTLDSAIDALRAAIGASRSAGAGKGRETAH